MRNYSVCKSPQHLRPTGTWKSSITFVSSITSSAAVYVKGVFGSGSESESESGLGLGFVWAVCVFSQMLFSSSFACIVFHQNDTSSSFPIAPELCLSQCSRPRNREEAPTGSFSSLFDFLFPRSLAEKMWGNGNGIGFVELFFDCSGAVRVVSKRAL